MFLCAMWLYTRLNTIQRANGERLHLKVTYIYLKPECLSYRRGLNEYVDDGAVEFVVIPTLVPVVESRLYGPFPGIIYGGGGCSKRPTAARFSKGVTV